MDEAVDNLAGEPAKKFFKSDEERILFIYVPLLLISAMVVGAAFGESYRIARVLELIFMFGLGVCMYAWCCIDSDARGYHLHRRFVYAVVIFGHLALFFYLFRSRGLGGGLLAILRYAIYIVILLLLSFIVTAILVLPFELFNGPPAPPPPRPA